MRRERPARLLRRSHRVGVLPLTSACNLRCSFCSNLFNPPGVEAVTIPPRDMDELAASLGELSGAEKIVIGESATRICEGEPLTHPRFAEVLIRVRERYPWKPIRVTTNGTLLDESIVRVMARLGDIEVTVSLNAVDPDVRRSAMGDADPRAVLNGVRLLRDWGVKFHGSVVAAREALGSPGSLLAMGADRTYPAGGRDPLDVLDRTIRFLEESGALSVRLMMPGHTRCYGGDPLSPPEVRLIRELAAPAAADDRPSPYSIPVTAEPPDVRDLVARVEGVIRDTPAARAGLARGDAIVEVDGVEPLSRCHAFNMMKDAANPMVRVARDGRAREVVLSKPAGQPPGVVMLYDVDPRQVRAAIRAAGTADRAGDAPPPLFVTSALGAPAVTLALRRWMPDARVVVARNRFFGGNIGCAGLLTVDDIVSAIRGAGAQRDEGVRPAGRGDAAARDRPAAPGVAVVPSVPFDEEGRDLLGRSYLDVERLTGITAVVFWEE